MYLKYVQFVIIVESDTHTHVTHTALLESRLYVTNLLSVSQHFKSVLKHSSRAKQHKRELYATTFYIILNKRVLN